MAQFFGTEDIKDLSKASQTTISWASGSNLRIGGQAYSVGSALVLDLATDIDTGSASGDTIYYVYAVVVAGVVSLKYSLSSTAPTGFVAFRKIGAFQTDGTPEIVSTSRKDKGSVGDVMHSRLTEEKFIEQNGAGWVLYDNRNISGSKLAAETGITNLDDARGVFLRGKNYTRSTTTGNEDNDLALGFYQDDRTRRPRGAAFTGGTNETGSHRHGDLRAQTSVAGNDSINGGTASGFCRIDNGGTQYDQMQTGANGNHFHSATITGGGDAATRPRNLTVNIFIKIDDIEL